MRKQEFVTAKLDFEHAHDRLIREEQRVDDISRQFAHRQGELRSIEEIRMYADFFARKRDEIKDRREQVSQLSHIVGERRESMLVAVKDKKVLEMLKEKKALEFRVEMDLKEQAFMDEISVQKNGAKH